MDPVFSVANIDPALLYLYDLAIDQNIGPMFALSALNHFGKFITNQSFPLGMPI